MTDLQAQCPGPLPWPRRLGRTCVKGRASRRLCTRPVREIVNQLRGEVHEVVADPAGHNQAAQASRHASLPTRSGECSATPADSAPAVFDPEHPRWLGLPSDNGIPARLNASMSASVTSSASGGNARPFSPISFDSRMGSERTAVAARPAGATPSQARPWRQTCRSGNAGGPKRIPMARPAWSGLLNARLGLVPSRMARLLLIRRRIASSRRMCSGA